VNVPEPSPWIIVLLALALFWTLAFKLAVAIILH
jgi:hypothetical protein